MRIIMTCLMIQPDIDLSYRSLGKVLYSHQTDFIKLLKDIFFSLDLRGEKNFFGEYRNNTLSPSSQLSYVV